MTATPRTRHRQWTGWTPPRRRPSGFTALCGLALLLMVASAGWVAADYEAAPLTAFEAHAGRRPYLWHRHASCPSPIADLLLREHGEGLTILEATDLVAVTAARAWGVQVTYEVKRRPRVERFLFRTDQAGHLRRLVKRQALRVEDVEGRRRARRSPSR